MHDQSVCFANTNRCHVLMITNHGVHEWEVVPGLPDTGGQNVYVNQFTEALVSQGYRVTIVNRGGYAHPVTGKPQRGMHYHPSGHARILYVEDGHDEFVRKEDMDKQIPRLADDLRTKLQAEGDSFDLIISHYWDAGKLGTLVNANGNGQAVPHVWIPHSLGALKKRNMDPSTWAALRIDERIDNESKLLSSINGAVATSGTIRDSFKDDYDWKSKYFLPPCVNPDRYHPVEPAACEPIWQFLSEYSPLSADELKQRRIITEISRTDKTKRKDVLIKSFAKVREQVPDALLVVSIDPKAGELHQALLTLISDLGLENDVVVLGSVWEQLPLLYNATTVYCTPSVMEGFGMSAQEATATGKPVVASNLVPFVVEYLLGKHTEAVQFIPGDSHTEYILGEAGAVVPADSVEGFAAALIQILSDDNLRHKMGRRALDITIPYFTWANRTKDLMEALGVTSGSTESKRQA